MAELNLAGSTSRRPRSCSLVARLGVGLDSIVGMELEWTAGVEAAPRWEQARRRGEFCLVGDVSDATSAGAPRPACSAEHVGQRGGVCVCVCVHVPFTGSWCIIPSCRRCRCRHASSAQRVGSKPLASLAQPRRVCEAVRGCLVHSPPDC